MADSLGQSPSKFMFISWLNPTEIRTVNMGRNLWPAEAKHLFFYQRQLNSRCCQHHIILEVPISLWVALRKVMSLNSWWLNGFCTGKSTPRCAVHAGVWCNSLCYQIRQRGKRDHKEISYFMRVSCSFFVKPVEHVCYYRMLPQAVSEIIKYLYLSLVDL